MSSLKILMNLCLRTVPTNSKVFLRNDDDDKLYFSVKSSSWPCKAY